MYRNGRLFRLLGGDLGRVVTHSQHVFVDTECDYYSLVEERCLDFIHWISSASA